MVALGAILIFPVGYSEDTTAKGRQGEDDVQLERHDHRNSIAGVATQRKGFHNEFLSIAVTH
jgi:hypothetical protein